MPTEFQTKVYLLCKQIPRGRVSSYKAIGNALGGKGQIYRAVGSALNKNPFAPQVPCHRVVCADGRIGGFANGCTHKIQLLKKEGIIIKKRKVTDFEIKHFQKFI
ncbi:MAG: MGMT family protein [Candidatus Woesearchaeota archaeon]|nr:MGMT family protein [Candidatus Woesearchaeota archaeon]